MLIRQEKSKIASKALVVEANIKYQIETIKLEKRFAEGKLDADGKKYLATKLYQDKFYEDSG